MAFRGTDAKIGSSNNGNYLGLIELLAEWDPFLKNHLDNYANRGKGHVSYLSKDICDEFIQLMGKHLQAKIVEEVKASKYYSISVDSTPDITNCDQLTFILRLVRSNGKPAERFLKFIPQPGHTANDLEIAVLGTLDEYKIDIMDCRGQSYDNASNMSGQYGGLQAKIKAHNPLAEHVPCAAHSLNLVGSLAADCCLLVTSFFMFVQQIYVFLSGSTGRWDTLKHEVYENGKGKYLPKNLSQTRWSQRYVACRALTESYESFCSAIESIAEGPKEKPETRATAYGLVNQFDKLETGILTKFWTDVLGRFDRVNKSLQGQGIHIGDVVPMYDSLKTYVESLRGKFSVYEEEGKLLSGCDKYEAEVKRGRKRKRAFDEGEAEESVFDARENFRVNTFLVTIDNLSSALSARSAAYSALNSRFGFLGKLSECADATLRENAANLLTIYPDDLDESISEEIIHFREFVKEVGQDQVAMDIDFEFDEGDVEEEIEDEDGEIQKVREISNDMNPIECLKLIRQKALVATFPNMDTILSIYASLLMTNASGERSFSTLKRVKNYLRNSIGQDKLSHLASFSINRELFDAINFDVVINDFASSKARKVEMK